MFPLELYVVLHVAQCDVGTEASFVQIVLVGVFGMQLPKELFKPRRMNGQQPSVLGLIAGSRSMGKGPIFGFQTKRFDVGLDFLVPFGIKPVQECDVGWWHFQHLVGRKLPVPVAIGLGQNDGHFDPIGTCHVARQIKNVALLKLCGLMGFLVVLATTPTIAVFLVLESLVGYVRVCNTKMRLLQG